MKNKIDQIQDKLNELQAKQSGFLKELDDLKIDLEAFKQRQLKKKNVSEIYVSEFSEKRKAESETIKSESVSSSVHEYKKIDETVSPISKKENIKKEKKQTNFEKLLGENLINKIGILITIIGVAIGAKYSIENNLISPSLRIILGYLLGFGLLLFGNRLRDKYENYSAVLVSGSLAIFYFISYFSYAFYALIPLWLAFALMFLFTVFAVIASLNYNKQVISIIGLVGAYAVPFFLSNNSGNEMVLFSYIAIINIGILVLSVKKYWKPLYFLAFGLTWLIFGTWQSTTLYRGDLRFLFSLTFSTFYFLIFYSCFISYKLIKQEKFLVSDIVLLLLNSFIYYALGYSNIISQPNGREYLGLFTILNAALHFVVSVLVYRKKMVDRNLFFLISGLVLIFITITIPIQLSGIWVTLSWALLGALLFWIGRTKQAAFYEKLSYPILFLAFFKFMYSKVSFLLRSDYLLYSEGEITNQFLLNVGFLVSLLTVLTFAYLAYLNNMKEYAPAHFKQRGMSERLSFAIPTMFVLLLFVLFWVEISSFWEYKYTLSALTIEGNETSETFIYKNNNLRLLKDIWLVNYTMLFVSILSVVNLKYIKSELLSKVNIILTVCAGLLFILQGLSVLSELRDEFLSPQSRDFYKIGVFNILIRYVSILVFSFMSYACYRNYKNTIGLKKKYRIALELLLHASILIVLSSELIYCLDAFNLDESYRVILTILWGFYSFLLVALGIWKKKKFLRIGAMALFGITLYKLFIYDVSNFNTISKTIVFICLGLLLLVISFLYNKYKHIISDENEKD